MNFHFVAPKIKYHCKQVNGEYITACPHDDAVNILRNAGDIVVLTVKHYKAATPFLQKQCKYFRVAINVFVMATVFTVSRETPDSDNDATCAELKADEGWKSSMSNNSRPISICSEPEKRWVDIVSGEYAKIDRNIQCLMSYLNLVPLMMAYVTRYIYGTDKLRSNAFEVRGLNNMSTGIINCDDIAILSQWLKLIMDNIVGLTHLQVKINEI